ncbi:SPFH domain-containing protein [Melittangium boletus]|uniref:Band 7 domain-containing protein n=1 Tax=Melittangium boletus DSM 14713 TaxID=1294270 RepID=A0A250IE91_9BACT|nr:SPFH domain-containing protein [Melittangium boletus]ATB29540.1 hypothetical protein MEBOL_002995 [Melittangium boletus DSM 14713]
MQILVLFALVGVFGLGAWLVLRSHRRVAAGEALILERGGAPTRVCFGGAWVVPLLHRAEVLDLSVRKVVVERRGRQGLSCRDGIRVDLRATFLVKVARREADVLRVAREVGCARANRLEEVQALLEERFACALGQSVSTFSFEELVADRSLFIDHVGIEVGDELLGFQMERMSLGRLEQTPLDQLDPTNVLDAQGIQKLTERASRLALEAGHEPVASPWDEPHAGSGEDERAVSEGERSN